MSHQPPIPPEQLSDKVYGEHSAPDRKPEVKVDPAHGTKNINTDEQGDAGNRHQNLNHAPGTQDR